MGERSFIKYEIELGLYYSKGLERIAKIERRTPEDQASIMFRKLLEAIHDATNNTRYIRDGEWIEGYLSVMRLLDYFRQNKDEYYQIQLNALQKIMDDASPRD